MMADNWDICCTACDHSFSVCLPGSSGELFIVCPNPDCATDLYVTYNKPDAVSCKIRVGRHRTKSEAIADQIAKKLVKRRR